MRKSLSYLIVIGLTLLVMNAIGFAEKGTNESNEKVGTVSAEAQAVADLALAAELAEYGQRTKSPLALIAAAQIMKNTPVKEEKRTKETEGDAGKSEGEKSASIATPESLLADAKALAESQNDNVALALIEKETKILAKRGAVGGPIVHADRVYPDITDVYTIRFKGGERAEVLVQGDGDCDLDLSVYDENGHFIAKDDDTTDTCYVEFSPRWTGPFKVRIKNYQCSVYADYVLLTN